MPNRQIKLVKQHMTAKYVESRNGTIGGLGQWLDTIVNDGGWELVQLGEGKLVEGRIEREAIFVRDQAVPV